MDWFETTILADTEMTVTCDADFQVIVWLVDGTGGCADNTTLRVAVADPGEQINITKCVPPGTYWVIVAPATFEGVTCGTGYVVSLACEPCTAPPAIECPVDTMNGQPAVDEDGAWSIYVSNDKFPGFDPAKGIKLLEHFDGVGGQIETIQWWGSGATFTDEGDLFDCPLDPGTFTVEFYAHDDETGRPDYVTGAIYTFTADAAAGLTVEDSGHVYAQFADTGEMIAGYPLYKWSIALPAPYAAFEGWIAIQNTDLCQFWWAKSESGGTIHVSWDEETGEKTDEDGDLAYCLLSSNPGPFTGACCDVSLGACRDTDATDCVGVYDVWYQGIDCATLGTGCQGVTWACCIAGDACITVDQASCDAAAGTFWNGYVCTTADPRYDGENLIVCSAPPVQPITCPTGYCHGVSLAGGYNYISWDRPGSRRHVIDDFDSCAQPITKVHWWGNSTDAWDGPDYDPPHPAPFVIRFYDAVAAPDVANEVCVYNVYAEWANTAYSWTGSPEYGIIEAYWAILAPPCAAGSGQKWISIAGADTDDTHDFIWNPGVDNGLMWFYADGAVTVEGDGSGGGMNRDRSFCLFTTIFTGACCDEETGICYEGEAEGDCLARPSGVFYEGEACASVVCDAAEGACCNRDTAECTIGLKAACDALGAPWEWLGVGSTCDDCCVIVCPAGGTLEGESVCFDGYTDTYNPGCFADFPIFPDHWLEITDGQTYCGEMGTYTTGGSDLRDFDWYYYDVTGPVALIKAHVQGEFQPDVYLLWPDPLDEGDGNCPSYIISEGGGFECDDVIASGALAQGRYFVAVSCFGTVDCGTPYNLWMTTEQAGCCTLAADPEDILFEASNNVCLAFGGTWEADVACEGGSNCLNLADSNCDGAVNAFDIDPFVVALADRVTWEATYTCDYLCANDVNCDGAVNAFDIDPFVACLASGGCGQCP